jgi:hypothetical protein
MSMARHQVSIRFAYSNNETGRQERLWKVVQSLTVEQAEKIAWLKDHKGSLVVGLHNTTNFEWKLLSALVSAWSEQCECLMEIAGPDFDSESWICFWW